MHHDNKHVLIYVEKNVQTLQLEWFPRILICI